MHSVEPMQMVAAGALLLGDGENQGHDDLGQEAAEYNHLLMNSVDDVVGVEDVR